MGRITTDNIKYFRTVNEFNSAYTGDGYVEPWVSYCTENSGVSFNKSEYEKLLGTPLTFKIMSGGTINWKANNDAYTKTIKYKLNDGEWTEITSNTGASAPSISVDAGDVVQFRGDNATYALNYSQYNSFSGSTDVNFEVEGNIMSLIDSTGYTTATTLASNYTFNYLFSNCTGLTSAENLVLPATTLTDYCYYNMFSNCASLTTTPELPATTLASDCYAYMFYGCTSLTTAPSILPATTLASYCYCAMFRDCTSLTQVPELPATALAQSCYLYMFEGCTNLTTAPALPATTLASQCYYAMFYNCTSLTTAPVLPATTLANNCYDGMFNGCISLNYIKCLATDISASQCTRNWVSNVASSGTFFKNSSMSSWTTGNNGIPTNWTVEDAS